MHSVWTAVRRSYTANGKTLDPDFHIDDVLVGLDFPTSAEFGKENEIKAWVLKTIGA